jgi:hypothetical protein
MEAIDILLLQQQRNRFRVALVGLVGADGAELQLMEAAMDAMPIPTEDKAAMREAIRALQEELV